ncbi:MAG: helicase-related protein [Telluria sp.]
MKRCVPFDQIIKSKAEQVAIQDDWDRQRTTAEKVAVRFEDDYDTVLLADEVGMGKTYVALAVMADYLWQSQENDRKVLLITPPSHVLRHKWVEEISSFSGKYVEGKGNKEMIPLNIGSHWELFRNLHHYQKKSLGQVRTATREAFLLCLFDWASSNQLLGKKPRLWPAVQNVDRLGSDYLDFISTYSLASLRKFLDEEYRVEKEWLQDQFKLLKADANKEWPLANLLKRFANGPNTFEPNVYVISMSALQAPRINEADNKLFSEYVLGHLVSGLHAESKALIVAALEQNNVLRSRVAYERWQSYQEKVLLTSRGDLYGLRTAMMRVVERSDVKAQWTVLLAQIRDGGVDAHAFFNWVRDLVFQAKLAESNIGLAVVDEVHNWKEGAHNASAFASQFASFIPHKLMMSATPFQVEQGEMKRVFDFVAHPNGKSAATVRTIFDANKGVIHSCLKASDTFAAVWKTLPVDVDNEEGAALLGAASNSIIRSAAKKIAKDGEAGEPMADFARALLAYRVEIDRMQAELRQIVIRHTKPRNKRDFRIGEHFHGGHPDGKPRTALYPSQGYGDEDGAMVNFIGMRLGQLVSRSAAGRPKTAAKLLRGLSSSTAAFLNGASARGQADSHANYGDMFAQVLAATTHPKVEATVTRAFNNFLEGRKTLIFCERVHTLEELRLELKKRIDEYHAGQYTRGGTIQRRSLMSRSDLVDNLWWVSLGDAFHQSETFGKALTTHERDAQEFVHASLNQARAKPSTRRIIRLLDAYLLANTAARNQKLMARWPHALGLFVGLYTALTSGPEEQRGSLLQAYVNGTGGQEADSARDSDDDAGDVARILQSQYRKRENLWCADKRAAFHTVLWDLLDSEAARLTSTKHEELPLRAFIDIVLHLMLGLRRVVLREDLITRYEAKQRGGTHFERISAGFANMDVGHGETMLIRTQRFIAGLLAEDGSINPADQGESKRKSMWSGILRTSVDHVSKMDGHTNPDTRRRLCASFNSPLLPDILVCSAIGSEGIDLHRHCADIIHHDLPWNPAKLEQRIGRLDRVNSLADAARNVRLTVGIPFLANDYEKYQYDVVFSRAQKFEILLGTPDFQKASIDEELYGEGEESIKESKDAAAGEAGEVMRALPEPLIRFLKVDLAVAGGSTSKA